MENVSVYAVNSDPVKILRKGYVFPESQGNLRSYLKILAQGRILTEGKTYFCVRNFHVNTCGTKGQGTHCCHLQAVQLRTPQKTVLREPGLEGHPHPLSVASGTAEVFLSNALASFPSQ